MFTHDLVPGLAQDEYVAQAVVQPPSGSPFPAFYLSQGPGPIQYNVTADGTAQFVGTNYSSRNTSFIDCHLKNPYSMTWSGGFQWEFHPNYLAELTYQGSAAVHLTGTSNMNTLPWSIYSSTDTTLLNAVFANSQAYLPYTQFGRINYTTNPGHSTFHEDHANEPPVQFGLLGEFHVHVQQESGGRRRKRVSILRLAADESVGRKRSETPVRESAQLRSPVRQGTAISRSAA